MLSTKQFSEPLDILLSGMRMLEEPVISSVQRLARGILAEPSSIMSQADKISAEAKAPWKTFLIM